MNRINCILLLANAALGAAYAEEVLSFRHQDYVLRFRRLSPEVTKRVDETMHRSWTNSHVKIMHLQFATMLEVAEQRTPDTVLNRALLVWHSPVRSDPEPWIFTTNNFHPTDLVVTQSFLVTNLKAWGAVNLIALKIIDVTNQVSADPIIAVDAQQRQDRTVLFRQFYADSFAWIDKVDTDTIYYRTVSHNGHTNLTRIPLPGVLRP